MKKIGIAGWATRTGIGQMCRELWDHKVASTWLAPLHPLLGVDPNVLPKHEGVVTCARNDEDGALAWLQTIDVLMLVEHRQPMIRRA